jgi:hypothetical protein
MKICASCHTVVSWFFFLSVKKNKKKQKKKKTTTKTKEKKRKKKNKIIIIIIIKTAVRPLVLKIKYLWRQLVPCRWIDINNDIILFLSKFFELFRVLSRRRGLHNVTCIKWVNINFIKENSPKMCPLIKKTREYIIWWKVLATSLRGISYPNCEKMAKHSSIF